MRLIRAAGGIVWRRGARTAEVLLVHRPKHDDWSLPKGKLERGERFRAAAIREVEEETGLRVRARGFAGLTAYPVRGDPKLVLFWTMEPLGTDEPALAPNDEVDAVAWATQVDALERLHHGTERRLLAGQVAPRWARDDLG
jgi:8-oxo-dGTP diphosphatase